MILCMARLNSGVDWGVDSHPFVVQPTPAPNRTFRPSMPRCGSDPRQGQMCPDEWVPDSPVKTHPCLRAVDAHQQGGDPVP